MMGLVIVCVLPQAIYNVVHAPPFDMTAYSDSVDYEFASIDDAIEFAALNSNAEWVKVNGEDIAT